MVDATIPAELIVQIGKIGLWIQALGIVVILAVIYWIVTMFYNRKRRKLLERINERLERIEMKVDSISRRKNN